MNLMNIRWIRGLLGSRWFPIVPQLILMVVMGLLIAGGIGVSTDDASFAKILRNTNLANLLVWSYWFPLVVVAAVLMGRVWCMVCPMELVTSLAGRIGLRQKVPRFLKSGWVIAILYTLILIVGVHTLAIHRQPHRMALYLLMLVGAAVVVGLLYVKRTFCSYVCPVGHLIGLYSLISPLEWRADDLSVCNTCKTKDCVVTKNQYKIVGRSCTSNLYPATINDNRDCLMCTQCLKACPSDNLRLSIRRPFFDFFGTLKLKASQVGFIVLVSGFVVYEILSEWGISKNILTWVPKRLVDATGINGFAADLISAVVMFVVFPAVLFLAVTLLSKMRSRISAATVVKSFALLLLPTMAGAHMIKAILKMTSRIPYFRHAFSDPSGITTAQKIVDNTLVLDKSMPNALYSVVNLAIAVVLLTSLAATFLIFRKSPAMQKLDASVKAPLALGVVLYWSIFGVMILMWRF